MANSLFREIILTARSPKRLIRGIFGDYREWLRRKHTGPTVALASYPRSGNTWVRHLVEKATGLDTGSAGYDRVLRRLHFDGVVTKTHGLDGERYEKAIHLIRMPFDAIESNYNFIDVVIGDHSPGQWDKFIRGQLVVWRDHYRHWSRFEGPRLLVRYEDLVADTPHELNRILDFVEMGVPQEAVIGAVETCSLERLRKTDRKYGQKFFRRGQVGASLPEFSDEQRKLVVSELESELEEIGYTELLQQLIA